MSKVTKGHNSSSQILGACPVLDDGGHGLQDLQFLSYLTGPVPVHYHITTVLNYVSLEHKAAGHMTTLPLYNTIIMTSKYLDFTALELYKGKHISKQYTLSATQLLHFSKQYRF